MKTVKLIVALCLFALLGRAQESLENGFAHLENGRFQQAETFFKDYLDTDPENKTAQICYGRAVGLNGAPQKAQALFGGLLETYPQDFEIAVNYNESLLWAGNYETALPLYEKLVADYPDRFPAVLGYANTLSNLKEYESALHWINKAITLATDNGSAKISRKYIKLGYANQFVNAQDYEQGKTLLQEVFTDFPDDKDALLNLANLYLITQQVDSAKATYSRYATTPKDSVTALNGMALAEHIGENEKAALQIAETARAQVARLYDLELTERTYERYVQTLIWNRKFGKARKQIDSLAQVYPDRNWILALKATLGLYTGDAKTSEQNYNAILAKDSTSFDGNLGKANALLASDKILPAYKAAFQTLAIYEDQKDALGFVEKLNLLYTPSIEEHAAYTFDNGNNVAFYTNTTADVPLSTQFRTRVSYGYRTTENTVSGNTADSHVVLAGLNYKLFPKIHLKTVVGFNNSRFMADTYTQPILEAKLQLQPLKLQNLTLGYQREVQNFNADLIEREIVQNHYGLNYNLGTNFNLGWYTQLMHTEQSDANTRDLLFTSLYYSLFRKPAVKLGINYQYLTFREQLPSIYFSPERYQAVEIFGEIRGKLSEKTRYTASMATGFQKVEEDPHMSIFRAEAGLQHQFSKKLSADLYGKYSNSASATAAGFEFTEIGFKLKWLLTKKPVFYAEVSE